MYYLNLLIKRNLLQIRKFHIIYIVNYKLTLYDLPLPLLLIQTSTLLFATFLFLIFHLIFLIFSHSQIILYSNLIHLSSL